MNYKKVERRISIAIYIGFLTEMMFFIVAGLILIPLGLLPYNTHTTLLMGILGVIVAYSVGRLIAINAVEQYKAGYYK